MRIAVVVGLSVLVCGAAVIAFQPSGNPVPPPVTSNPPAPPPPLSQRTRLVQLATLGAPADLMLAAGLTPSQIEAAAQRLVDNAAAVDTLDTLTRQISSLRTQLRQAAAAANSSQSQTGLAGTSGTAAAPVDVAALELQVTNLETQSRAQRDALTALIFAEASAEQQAAVERAKKCVELGLRPSMALAAATDAELVAIAEATKAERRAQRTGESLETQQQQVLLAARANPSAAAAASRLDTQWPPLKAALAAVASGGNP